MDDEADRSTSIAIITGNIPLINGRLDTIGRDINSLDRDIESLKDQGDEIKNNLSELRRETSAAITRSIVTTVAIVTALSALGAIYGFGSVNKLKLEFEKNANEVTVKADELSKSIDSMTESATELGDSINTNLTTLEESVDNMEQYASSLSASSSVIEKVVDDISSKSDSIPDIDHEITSRMNRLDSILLELENKSIFNQIIVDEKNGGESSQFNTNSSDTDELAHKLEAAMLSNDLDAMNAIANALSNLQKTLDPRELGLLSVAAIRTRNTNLAISAAEEGILKIGSSGDDSTSARQQKAIFYARIGDAYQETGKQNESENAYKKCLEIDPEYDECLNNLSNLYFGQSKYIEACSLLDRALNSAPQLEIANNAVLCYASAYYFPSDDVEKQSLVGSARSAADVSLSLSEGEIDEKRGEAILSNAIVLFLEGRLTKAQEAFDQALQLNPVLLLLGGKTIDEFMEVIRLNAGG